MPYCLHCGHILEEDEKTVCTQCKRDELIRRSTQGDPREHLRAKKLGQNRPPVAGGKSPVLRERPGK